MRRGAWPIGILLGALFPALAGAQRLTIQGDRFAVDGAPRFLTFISYFGAMGAADAAADLQFLREAGFDGVRIWPNSPDGPQLMRGDGTLDAASLARLREILDRAREQRLVVDVTFTAEHISGLGAPGFQSAVAAATRALVAYDHVLFDIQNERDVYGPFGRPLAQRDVAAIAATIRSVHAERIITASNTPNTSPGAAARFTVDTGVDVTAYHEARVPDWYQSTQIQSTVDALRASGRPVYLQEPTRFPFPSTDRADYFRTARANAKRAGAAAWCFHTDLGFNLRSVRFRTALASRLEPEWNFVASLILRVNLRTSDGAHYVVAEGGGGGAVRGDRRVAGSWETFAVSTLDGGPALGGNRIALQTADGQHYLQALEGGGAPITAAGTGAGPWETFIIDNGRDEAIRAGDTITLRTATDPAWFVTAEQGGGADVTATRRAAGDWERFTIVVVTPSLAARGVHHDSRPPCSPQPRRDRSGSGPAGAPVIVSGASWRTDGQRLRLAFDRRGRGPRSAAWARGNSPGASAYPPRISSEARRAGSS